MADMRRALIPLVLAAACGGGAGDGPDATAGDPDPDFDDTAAWIEVAQQTFAGGGSTYISASLVLEDPIWPYDVEAPVGACRFSLRREMTCGFDCDGVCVGDECEPLPVPASAGDLTLSAGGVTRTVPFGDAGYSHYEPNVTFLPGADLTVSAPGDVVAAFSLATEIPRSFALSNPDELRLRVGTPLVLRWEPDDPGSRVRLVLGADLGHARYRSALIECDVPDEDGRIEVPQELSDRLADPALWSCGDCFSQSMRRYRRARGQAGDLPLTLWATQSTSLYLVPEP
jgi:hypothetical protein